MYFALSQGTFIFCTPQTRTRRHKLLLLDFWSPNFSSDTDLSWKPFTFETLVLSNTSLPDGCWGCWREEHGDVKTAWDNRWPSVLASYRIQRDRPAQRDGRQRLLPGEGLETHTAAVCGPSVEEAADYQRKSESEGILCSGDSGFMDGRWLPDQRKQEKVMVKRGCWGQTLCISIPVLFLAAHASAGKLLCCASILSSLEWRQCTYDTGLF